MAANEPAARRLAPPMAQARCSNVAAADRRGRFSPPAAQTQKRPRKSGAATQTLIRRPIPSSPNVANSPSHSVFSECSGRGPSRALFRSGGANPNAPPKVRGRYTSANSPSHPAFSECSGRGPSRAPLLLTFRFCHRSAERAMSIGGNRRHLEPTPSLCFS